jgi:hypothetical protein
MKYDFDIDDIRNLCGHVQNGTGVTIMICQDDATHTWVVTVGEKDYYGSSMAEALKDAIEGEPRG